jgi:ribosomal protein S18 acetylase RimI-like enzyme
MVTFAEREMTPGELALMNSGFAANSLEHGNPTETSVRYGFVAIEDGTFMGCSSGLATMNIDSINIWFYLTDLYVEKEYRRQGIGKTLLESLENRVRNIGIKNIWTWTAGYEAPAFYQKQGYTIFAEFKSWYPSGHSRIGLWKLI